MRSTSAHTMKMLLLMPLIQLTQGKQARSNMAGQSAMTPMVLYCLLFCLRTYNTSQASSNADAVLQHGTSSRAPPAHCCGPARSLTGERTSCCQSRQAAVESAADTGSAGGCSAGPACTADQGFECQATTISGHEVSFAFD